MNRLFTLQTKESWLVSVCVILLPYMLLMFFLEQADLIFFSPFDVKIITIDVIVISLLLLFSRSFVVTFISFNLWMLAPFVSYYFLRRGILYSDFYNLDELIYTVEPVVAVLIAGVLLLLISLFIKNNIQKFSKSLLVLQVAVVFILAMIWKFPEQALNHIYQQKPNIDHFNLSANFRFIGVNHGMLYSLLDTRVFERKIQNSPEIKKYLDFRQYDQAVNNGRNIHIIVLESFLNPLDLKNIKVASGLMDAKWDKWERKYGFQSLSPVHGGGSAQAEFEILCGASSILKYGTEFNRLGSKPIKCLPNFLKKSGYLTIASQPIYGSFFNTQKSYKSVGFDHIWLADSLDMSKKVNNWLTDESFLSQHYQRIQPYLKKEQPVLNYLFAVGCHTPYQPSKTYPKRVDFKDSDLLENFLNCYLEASKSVVQYIQDIRKLDPNGIILIIPDHLPGVGYSTLKTAGLKQILEWGGESDSLVDKINNAYLLTESEYFNQKPVAYYEIPELLVNILTNGKLCETYSCWSDSPKLYYQGKTFLRDSYSLTASQKNDKRRIAYQEQLNLSLIRESSLGK